MERRSIPFSPYEHLNLEKACIVEEDANENRSIVLFDGPGTIAPPDVKLVCFTSLDNLWFDNVLKNQYHVAFYMPIWSLDELHDAVLALELERDEKYPVDEEMVDNRFRLFGGVARYCLAVAKDFVAAEKSRLDRAITIMFDVDYISRLVRHEQSLLHHQFCYYIPIDGNSQSYTVRISSNYAEELLLERICKRELKPREELLQYVRQVCKLYSL